MPQDSLQQDFVTILAFLGFGALFVVLNMVAIGRLIRSRTKYSEGKSTPYECGEPTFGSAFVRFDIRFYVLALVFVVFDVEVVFLFPWAAVLKDLGPLAFVEGAVFVLVLAVGLAYVWRKGDIDWKPVHGWEKKAAAQRDSILAAPPEDAGITGRDMPAPPSVAGPASMAGPAPLETSAR